MPKCDRSCCQKECKRRTDSMKLYNDYVNKLMSTTAPKDRKRIKARIAEVSQIVSQSSKLCKQCSDQMKAHMANVIRAAPTPPTNVHACKACEEVIGDQLRCNASRGKISELRYRESQCQECLRRRPGRQTAVVAMQKLRRFMSYCKAR